MALINCPECGKEISDKAKHCIRCGYPLEDNNIQELNFEDDMEECPHCHYANKKGAKYCSNCGVQMNSSKEKSVVDKIADSVVVALGMEPFKESKKPQRFVDNRGKNIYYSRERNPNFNGIYKAGGRIEVYCPRCGSSNCSHYKEQQYIPAKTKTSYTANINPLKPFTLVNKKEKIVRKERTYTENKFMCNSCGHIFY